MPSFSNLTTCWLPSRLLSFGYLSLARRHAKSDNRTEHDLTNLSIHVSHSFADPLPDLSFCPSPNPSMQTAVSTVFTETTQKITAALPTSKSDKPAVVRGPAFINLSGGVGNLQGNAGAVSQGSCYFGR